MPTGLPRNVQNHLQQQQQQQQMYQQEDAYNDPQWEDQPQSHHILSGPTQQQAAEKPTGLRHFSTKVCEKVKEKGLTNYNEVADELVADYFQNNMMKQVDVVKQEYDMKNIRRRVYDALNVLLAMNIITKNKKDIRWIGLPASASQEITRLEEEKLRREASIQSKKEALQQMILQIICYKNLIARNRKNEHINGRPDPDTLLHLPFMIINTDRDTSVECSVSSDKSEFLFSFDKKFEIHDDFEVLKKLKLTCGLDDGTSTPEDIEKAKKYLPALHKKYIDEIIETRIRHEQEKEENKRRMLEHQKQLREEMEQMEQQQQQNMPTLYYDEDGHAQPMAAQPQNPGGRFNRQLQEHLMHDGNEDRSAADGIMEVDNMMESPKSMGPPGSQIQRASLYNYSPSKMRLSSSGGGSMGAPLQAPATTRRYYVQKPQVPVQQKRDMSPAIRSASHPYRPPQHQQQGRLIAGGGTVGGGNGGGPVKYYVPQAGQQQQQAGGGPLHSQGGSRFIQRVRPQPPLHQQQPQHHQPIQQQQQLQQRVVYTNSNGAPLQLGPGQRIVTQRIVTPGPTPGTVVRKIVRKIVNANGVGVSLPKQSPAQQVIQKRMMEQELKPDQHPMTSAQAAAMIQHPPVEDFDYFE